MRPTPSLAPHYFVAGLAGGWLTADAHRLGLEGPEVAFRVLLVSVTPLTAALLGAHVKPDRTAGPLTTALSFCAKTILAGALNGLVIGCFALPGWGILIGAVWGLVCAIPFLPALGAIALTAHRVGRARSGSLVDASDRRAPVAATAAAVAGACLVAALVQGPDAPRQLAALGAALAAFVALALDLHTLFGCGRRLPYESELRPRDPAADRSDLASLRTFDYGLGDEVRDRVLPAAHAYRSVDRVVSAVLGDASSATRAVLQATLVDSAALTLSLVAAATAA